VDAPGVRDDNSARDAIVKSKIKAAGLILIVSRIQRAVNDRSARSLLSDGFRRQIVMDGRHSSSQLAFVCTQSDVLVRGELAGNLKLPENATARECAIQRNLYSKTRIQADFVAGLRDVMMAANDADGDMDGAGEMNDAEMERRLEDVKLPVFCVSSIEYQRLAGIMKEQASCFKDVLETGIPAVQDFLYSSTTRTRQAKLQSATDRLVEFLRTLENLLVGAEGPANNQDALREIHANLFSEMRKETRPLDLAPLRVAFTQVFPAAIATAKTGQSALTAQYSQKWTPGGWRKDDKVRKGGLHFSTMRALARRSGRYNSPSVGLIDFSEEMCEPLMGTLAPAWERVFSVHLPSLLKAYCLDAVSSVSAALSAFQREAEHLGEGSKMAFLGQLRVALTRIAQLWIEKSLEEVTKRQMDISRECVPVIQKALDPHFLQMGNVTGQGSRNRMCEMLKAGCNKESQTVFASAARHLSDRLNELFADVMKLASGDLMARLLQEVDAHLSVLFEKLPQSGAQRQDLNAELVPVVRQLLDSVQNLQPQSEYFVAPEEEAVAVEGATAPPDPGQDRDKRERDEAEDEEDQNASPAKKSATDDFEDDDSSSSSPMSESDDDYDE
jgi:hypothetical protein